MTTLYFTRLFVKGNLKGILHNDKIRFIDEKTAVNWVNGINKKKSLEYRIIDKSFQNYVR
jgi:hypothetical protein